MSLNEKALLIAIDFTIPSGKKVDARVSNNVADQYKISGGRKNSGNFSKVTIDPKFLKEPMGIKRRAVRAFDKMTLPWLHEDIKINLLPNSRYFEFSQIWRECKRDMSQYRWNLENGLYDEMMQESQTRLSGESQGNGLFVHWDYPPVDEFVGKFSMNCFVRPVPSADSMDLRVAVGEEESERIRIEIQESMDKQFEETRLALCDRIVEAVQHMKTVLSKDKPVIHETLMEKMEDLVDILPELNFSDDEDLDNVRDIIKEELVEDVQTLRDDKLIQKDVLNSTESILSKMEKIYAARTEA